MPRQAGGIWLIPQLFSIREIMHNIIELSDLELIE